MYQFNTIEEALEDLRADMLDIEEKSHLVDLSECRTSWFGTLLSAALRLLAPLC